MGIYNSYPFFPVYEPDGSYAISKQLSLIHISSLARARRASPCSSQATPRRTSRGASAATTRATPSTPAGATVSYTHLGIRNSDGIIFLTDDTSLEICKRYPVLHTRKLNNCLLYTSRRHRRAPERQRAQPARLLHHLHGCQGSCEGGHRAGRL